jgi:RNA polymerase sigma-70 factor (ECF subfamily)
MDVPDSGVHPVMPPREPAQARASADRELMERVCRGDGEALERLYDRYAGTVCALAFRISSNRAEAEEITQEVFWQVWKQATRFDAQRGSFSAWLLTMTRNRALDGVRARGSAHQATERAGQETEVARPAPATPEADTALGEQAGAVRRALAELPDPQRRALELAYFGGFTHAEIASQTGDPIGTVKSRIAQGILKLRALLSDLGL